MDATTTTGQCVDNLNYGNYRNYELRFQSVFKEGRGWAFACDERGCVDLDRMSDRDRSNYFFVRTVIGREVTQPRVHLVA